MLTIAQPKQTWETYRHVQWLMYIWCRQIQTWCCKTVSY